MGAQEAEETSRKEAALAWRASVDPAIASVVQAAMAQAPRDWPSTRTGLVCPVGTGAAARAFVEAAPAHVDRWMLLDPVGQRLDHARETLQSLSTSRGLFWQTRSMDGLALADGVLAAACLLPSTTPGAQTSQVEHIASMLASGAPVLYIDLPCTGLLADFFLDALVACSTDDKTASTEVLRQEDEAPDVVFSGWTVHRAVVEEVVVPLAEPLADWWLASSVAGWVHRLERPDAFEGLCAAVGDAWKRYGDGHAHAAALSLRATWLVRAAETVSTDRTAS